MTYPSEYSDWQEELSGEKRSASVATIGGRIFVVLVACGFAWMLCRSGL